MTQGIGIYMFKGRDLWHFLLQGSQGNPPAPPPPPCTACISCKEQELILFMIGDLNRFPNIWALSVSGETEPSQGLITYILCDVPRHRDQEYIKCWGADLNSFHFMFKGEGSRRTPGLIIYNSFGAPWHKKREYIGLGVRTNCFWDIRSFQFFRGGGDPRVQICVQIQSSTD